MFSNLVSGLKISDNNKLLKPYLPAVLGTLFNTLTVGSKLIALPITLLNEFSWIPLEFKVTAVVFNKNFSFLEISKVKLAEKLPLSKRDLSFPPTIPPWVK